MKELRSLLCYCCLAATAVIPDIRAELSATSRAIGLSRSEASIQPRTRADVYVSMGEVTNIMLKSRKRIDRVDLGSSDAVLASYDKELGILRLEPVTDGALTNVVIVSGGQLFELKVHVVDDPKVRTALTVTLEGSVSDEWSPPANVPSLRPDRIDINDKMDRIEEATRNPAYLEGRDDMLLLPVGRTLIWNNSPVTHETTAYFPKEDLLVLKYTLHNRTAGVLYLHARQYRLRIANTQVPVTVCTQLSKELFPGQMDEVYLFVQGYRIAPTKDFTLQLPAQSASLRRLVRSNGR